MLRRDMRWRTVPVVQHSNRADTPGTEIHKYKNNNQINVLQNSRERTVGGVLQPDTPPRRRAAVTKRFRHATIPDTLQATVFEGLYA